MKRLRRIVAGLTVVFIVALLIGTLICAITGSKYFFGMLVLTLVVPVVLWVFMWFTHLIHNDSEVIPKADMELLNQSKTQKDMKEKEK